MKARSVLATFAIVLAALISASPVAADPPVGTCPGPFETFIYPQPPSTFFASVDLNLNGVVCLMHQMVTPSRPDPISVIDDNSQKPPN
jgi:hypothetical protein